MKETGVVVSATELRARNSRLINAARGGGTVGGGGKREAWRNWERGRGRGREERESRNL